MTSLAEALMFMPLEARSRMEREAVEAHTRVLAEMERERLALKPVVCLCGRGIVVSLVGCAPCREEAAVAYVADLEIRS